jgi:hypothetical protein
MMDGSLGNRFFFSSQLTRSFWFIHIFAVHSRWWWQPDRKINLINLNLIECLMLKKEHKKQAIEIDHLIDSELVEVMMMMGGPFLTSPLLDAFWTQISSMIGRVKRTNRSI